MIENPKVSVIIPSYNKHHLLKDAVKSVLEQTFKDFEIHVINDFPSEESKIEIDELSKRDERIHVTHNESNQGIAASRNIGIGRSKGKYTAFLDHDDTRREDKLDLQTKALDLDRNIGIIGTQAVMTNTVTEETRLLQYHLDHQNICKYALLKTPFLQSASMIRKKAFDKVGYYDSSVSMCDDSDMFLKMLLQFEGKNIPEFATSYRVYGDSTSVLQQEKMRWLTIKYHMRYGQFPYYHRTLLRKIAFATLPNSCIKVLSRAKHILKETLFNDGISTHSTPPSDL